MKKNTMMRIASVLLVVVLLTTSVISGTFAKYVVSDNSFDSARVAAWGVNVVASGDALFNNEYTNTPNGLTVKSADDKKVVAPGTSNAEFAATGLTFAITGAPEVAVKITYDFTVNNDIFLRKGVDYKNDTTGGNPDDIYRFDDKDYHPVVFTLSDKTGVIATGNLAAIKAKFDELTNASEKIEANTALNNTYVLTWAWEFGDPANNLKDTTLGNLVTGAASTAPANYSINLGYELEITVEQVD